jgi:hypothetical protein
VKLGFIDLYDRNPTSTDKKVDVDEAWMGLRPKASITRRSRTWSSTATSSTGPRLRF